VIAIETWASSGFCCTAGAPCSFTACTAFVLPVPRWPGAALRLPSRCGRTLLRPRPESAIRIGAPRRSHTTAPPSPRHGSCVRDPRAPEELATRGTGGLNTLLPENLETDLLGGVPSVAARGPQPPEPWPLAPAGRIEGPPPQIDTCARFLRGRYLGRGRPLLRGPVYAVGNLTSALTRARQRVGCSA
jgi:hypothetical protein